MADGILYYGCDGCTSTPDGKPCPAIQTPHPFPSPGSACYSLIGVIGDGTPFQVGSNNKGFAETSGELLLGDNDEWPVDNSEGWQATIKLQPLVSLIKATTSHASNISVNYIVSDSNAQQIQFDIFRSDTNIITNNSVRIGNAAITDVTDVSIGLHKDVILISNTPLLPDTRLPFIIVASNCKGETDTTYFQKWLLGAISHGFDRYAMYGDWVGAKDGTFFYGLPEWETNMANNLKQFDKYDDVISFDWMRSCGVAKPGLAEAAGELLKNQVIDWITTNISHEGDVVDLHLIGHSRGTVVVTQAINKLLLDPVGNYLKGSYIELTLLDPHPANNEQQKIWGSWGIFPNKNILNGGCGFQGVALIDAAKKMTSDFQNIVHDSYLVIPPGVRGIDVWWQHTDANNLCLQPYEEYIQNLWGMITNSTIRNNNSLSIDLLAHAFVDKNIDGIGFIGHNEVPLVYEKQVVETGTLNRTK